MPIAVMLEVFNEALASWWGQNRLRLGASVAYYTLFALAPMLIVVTAVAGSVFGTEAVRGQIAGQIDQLVGVEGSRAVQALLQGAARRSDSVFAAIVGSVTFVLAACGAFLELQAAMNTIWRVKSKPAGVVREFLVNRAQSFGLVVAAGFLLMVSLAASAALAALGGWLATRAPAIPIVLHTLNFAVSFSGTVVLFGLLLKFLPDVELAWKDVAAGAVVTAILFLIGKQAIASYLGHSGTASSYGAVGSVLVLLLWVYYSSQTLLIGAEFTRLYADRTRGTVPASTFARVVEDQTLRLFSGEADRRQGAVEAPLGEPAQEGTRTR